MNMIAKEPRPDYRKAERDALRLIEDFSFTVPPVNPVQIARDLGIKVYFVSFGPAASDVSGFYDCDEDAIFVNREEVPLRQNFTVAHELGHKRLHEDWAKSSDYKVLLRDSSKQVQDFREREANAFAANLLMPRFMTNLYWDDLTVEQLSTLFAVSVPAIRARISFLYGV